MKKLLPIVLCSLFIACTSLAVEPASDAVVAISLDEIRNNAESLEGQHLVSTGQPDREVLELLKSAGFTTVIDMRTASEDRGYDESSAVESLGMSYVSLPVAVADGVNFENARKLDKILADVDGPVLLHCRSGNRVGALEALRASMQGASDEEAIAIGKSAGLTRLEPVVRQRLTQE